MTSKERNDFFYVCSLIEFIARKTKNQRSAIVKLLGAEGMKKQLKDAEVNHCLSFEQVSDELIEKYHITIGEFDTITNCKYTVPGYVDIGKLYTYILEKVTEKGEEVTTLIQIFESFLSDEISDFKTGVYIENPDYLAESYKAGVLLD